MSAPPPKKPKEYKVLTDWGWMILDEKGYQNWKRFCESQKGRESIYRQLQKEMDFRNR